MQTISGDGLGFGELFGADGAEADVADKALLFELGEDGRPAQRWSRVGPCRATHAKVDDLERFETEVLEVVVHALDEVLRGSGPGSRSRRCRGWRRAW
jgi:hypothetical protein